MEKNLASEGSGDSFEDAARRVSEPERPKEDAPDKPEEQSEEQPGKFIVDDGVAIWTVQKVFWPLQVYDHAAWEVTDEEAALVSPKLRPFLQKFFDRYIPDWMSRYASENKELAELVVAFGMLFVIKRTQVNRLKRVDALIEEAKRKEKEAANPPIDISKPVQPAASPAYEFHVPKPPEERKPEDGK